MGLGSGIRKKPILDLGSRIRVQGSKRHRIPDPGSRSATLILLLKIFCHEKYYQIQQSMP
jgi:hypothetical protein